jgi:class 3 adenylate cyclase
MSLNDDLQSEVAEFFKSGWDIRDGTVVPDTDDLALGNEGVRLEATVLYADMAGSTALVDNYKGEFAAEIYKAYLHCAAKAVRNEGGEITAYDGDRIMAVFLGESKNTSAARAALKINYARIKIINPAIKAQYRNTAYQVEHAVGIDTSSLLVARTGVRGSNDLVWVGRAANYAAKLTDLAASYTYITKDVYDVLNKSAKISDGAEMWERMTWTAMKGLTIYRSSWWWSV